MINKDFYPTPSKLIGRMVALIQDHPKTILEPSAGAQRSAGLPLLGKKGNICQAENTIKITRVFLTAKIRIYGQGFSRGLLNMAAG